MIPSSQLDLIAERPIYHLSAFVYKSGKTFSDDDIIGKNCDFTLNYDDFYITGNKFNIEGGSMPIGNCVSKTCTLSLKSSDKYTVQDLVGAHMVLTISAVQNDNDVEIVGAPGGYYFVETVAIESGKIKLECVDLMCKANKYYTYDVEFKTNAGVSATTFFDLWKSVLAQMGIDAGDAPDIGYNAEGLAELSDLILTNTYSFGVHNRLKNGKWTCREILEFIAMVCIGNVAIFPGYSAVYINSLLYYNSAGEYKLYGRTLKNNWISFTDGAEATPITGVKCVVSTDANGNDITPIEYHSDTYSDKYVLDVTGNPLIAGADVPTTALNTLYGYINSLPLHGFSGKFMAFPLLEYGDYVSATYLDASGADVNVKTFITSFEFDPNGVTNIACDVETSAENGQTFSGGSTSSAGGTTLDIDNELNSESTNPVQNKAIKAALDKKLDKSEYVIDSELSGASTNPVQNKTLTVQLQSKFDKAGGEIIGDVALLNVGKLTSKPGKIAVFTGDSNIIYYRTFDELLSDLGVADKLDKSAVDSKLDGASTNPVQNKAVKTELDKKADKTALDNKFDKTGGTLTGNLIGKYLSGTWLQTTQTSDLNSKPGKIAVLDELGWVYYRTPAELASDIGVVAPADYIVEKGTSSGWQYRKWNSGVAECWRDLSVSGKACSTAVGSWFRTAPLSVGAYPFTFTAAPNLQMQFETFAGTGGLVWSTGTAGSTPKTRPANIYIIRMASATSITGTVHYYAIGQWK